MSSSTTSLTGSVRKFSNALMFPAKRGVLALAKTITISTSSLASLGNSVRSAFSKNNASEHPPTTLVRLIVYEPRGYGKFKELLNSNNSSCAAMHLNNMELYLKQYATSTMSGENDLEASLKANEFKQFVQTTKTQMTDDAQFNFDDELLSDCIETLLASGIYERVHSALATRDRQIRLRFKRLRFVSPSNLGVASKYVCVKVWREAAETLAQIDKMRTPFAIVSVLLSASLTIYNELNAVDRRLGAESAAAADEFIPVLAYILLNANIKRLATALAMVSSFRAESMLLGEDGYYVVSFLVAFEFLQSRDIGSKLVGITEVEFDRQMAFAVRENEIEDANDDIENDDDEDFEHEWPQLVEQKDLDEFVQL